MIYELTITVENCFSSSYTKAQTNFQKLTFNVTKPQMSTLSINYSKSAMFFPSFTPSISLPPIPRKSSQIPSHCPHPTLSTRRHHPKSIPNINATPENPLTDRHSPESLGFLHIATITGPHGVKGEAKAFCTTDFANYRLGPGAATRTNHFLLLPGRRYPRPVQLVAGRPASQKHVWIIQLAGVNSRHGVDNIRAARLFVKDTDRPRLPSNQFLVGDLVGARVYVNHQPDLPIAVVESVITSHELCAAAGSSSAAAAVASDLIQIVMFQVPPGEAKFQGHLPEDAKRVLVPFVKQVVPEVDPIRGVIILDPPKGLLDIAVVNRKQKPRPPRGLLMPAKK